MSTPAANAAPIPAQWRGDIRRALPRWQILVIAPIMAAWSAFCIVGITGGLGFTGPISVSVSRAALYLLVLVPVTSAALVVVRRRQLTTELKLIAGWAWLILLAVIGEVMVSQATIAVLVIPPLAIFTLIFWPRPLLTVPAMFFFSAFYGTTTIYVSVLHAGLMADTMGAVLLLGMIWRVVTSGRPSRAQVWPGIVLAGVYLGISILMIVGSGDVTRALLGFHLTQWHMAFFLLIGYAGWSQATYEQIAKVLLVIAFAAGAYATLRYFTGPTAKEQALAGKSTYNTVDNKLKTIGSFTGNHDLGFWTSIMMAFSFAHVVYGPKLWRIFAAITTGLLATGLLASGVRTGIAGAIVSLTVVTLLFVASRGFAGRKLASGILIPAVGAVAAVLLFTTVIHDTSRYTALLHPFNDYGFLERYDKWRTMLHQIHHPFGEGIGTAGLAQQRYGRFTTIGSLSVESGYVQAAYQQGYLVTGLLILALIMTGTGLAQRAIATNDPRRAVIAIGAVGALASYLVNLVADPYQDTLTAVGVWVVLGVGVAQFSSSEEPAETA